MTTLPKAADGLVFAEATNTITNKIAEAVGADRISRFYHGGVKPRELLFGYREWLMEEGIERRRIIESS